MRFLTPIFFPRFISLILSLFLVFLSACDCQNSVSADETNLDKNVELVATSTQRWTGLALSATGRLFVNYPNWSSDHTLSVAELVSNNSEVKPFPDVEWNEWTEGKDPVTHLIAVQSVFIDADNFLWILDTGNLQRDGIYQGVIPGGAKLIKVDLSTNAVVQTIVFNDPVIKPNSYLNDVRINEQRNAAYITDSNAGALIIVDLLSGTSRRILENDPSTKSENKILTVEGEPYRNQQGEYPIVHADGIALTNDHLKLYWRSLTGEKLYSLETSALHDASLSDEMLGSRITTQGPFPPSDGMIFGFYNDLYLTSIEENAIRAYGGGNETRLVRQRKDFKWPDSFAIGPDGYLYFTTSQVHLTHPSESYKIFKFQIKF
jgi:sugar lactone lactonase YvrE